MLRLVGVTALLLAVPSGSGGVLAAQTINPGQALGACMAESTTGRDRKDLAKWIFYAMAAHPEMKGGVPRAAAEAETTSKVVGALVTRLLTDPCLNEARGALQGGSTPAFQIAFEQLGKLAMAELMADPAVEAAFGAMAASIDQKRVTEALAPR